MDLIKIAVMGLSEAKELQKDCRRLGAELILNHDDDTCSRGCAVTVEVHAGVKDIKIIQKIYSEKFEKMMEGHEVNHEVMGSVYDSSAESATCPACGHNFSTSNTECPDCGLMIG